VLSRADLLLSPLKGLAAMQPKRRKIPAIQCPVPGASLFSLVVAVILIALVSSLALARFASGETRSKMAQARTDMRILARAMVDYRADWNVYPITYAVGNNFGDYQIALTLPTMTTPVAYLARTSFINPFGETLSKVAPDGVGSRPMYILTNYEGIVPGDWATQVFVGHGSEYSRAFMVWSSGPDQTDDSLYWAGTFSGDAFVNSYRNLIYDPTNGIISKGDMALVGGDFSLPELGLESQ
jgi:hypothetical protein